MNRLREFFEDPEQEVPEGDYYTIETFSDTFVVSAATASEVERELDRPSVPRWVVFRDLSGARHRLLTHLIERVSECTTSQRAARRAFSRARKLEEKADRRPWEED